jgi:hypothetical protein
MYLFSSSLATGGLPPSAGEPYVACLSKVFDGTALPRIYHHLPALQCLDVWQAIFLSLNRHFTTWLIQKSFCSSLHAFFVLSRLDIRVGGHALGFCVRHF